MHDNVSMIDNEVMSLIHFYFYYSQAKVRTNTIKTHLLKACTAMSAAAELKTFIPEYRQIQENDCDVEQHDEETTGSIYQTAMALTVHGELLLPLLV